MKVGASKGVIRVDLKKAWPGGGVSGQPENLPGYATGLNRLMPPRASEVATAFVNNGKFKNHDKAFTGKVQERL